MPQPMPKSDEKTQRSNLRSNLKNPSAPDVFKPAVKLCGGQSLASESTTPDTTRHSSVEYGDIIPDCLRINSMKEG